MLALVTTVACGLAPAVAASPASATESPAAGEAAPASCEPGAFDAVVPGWPHFTGTTVLYCDGQWAQAGADQTDWIIAFRNAAGKWEPIEPAGESGTGFACYDVDALRNQGAPQEFVDSLLACR